MEGMKSVCIPVPEQNLCMVISIWFYNHVCFDKICKINSYRYQRAMVGYILQIKVIITCFWVHNCFSPVLSICQGQGFLRWSYSAFSCAWYLDSKSVGWEKLLLERQIHNIHAACFVWSTANIACCILVFLWKWRTWAHTYITI